MKDILSDLKKELEPFKNTLVIGDFYRIVRLVDVVDGEDDYYWVYDTINGTCYSTCVGGWIPLKGFIDKDKYDRMVHVWNLNKHRKSNLT